MRASHSIAQKPHSSRLYLMLPIMLSLSIALIAQIPAPRARLNTPIDNEKLVTLRGNTHPLAQARYDRGAAPDSLPARRMMMLLSRSQEQQAALDKLMQEQLDPSSPNFRHWISPDEFATTYGPSTSDIQQISGWLQTAGFTVNRVGAGNTVIEFTGTAGQVRAAFHTQIHKYIVEGRESWANSTDPKMPAALTPVVQGIVSLNNFPRRSASRRLGVFQRDSEDTLKPQFTVSDGTTTYYALGPADVAAIYNTKPLITSGIDGRNQTIAILGASNVNLQDVTDFRNLFGLGVGNTSVIIDGTDPGIVDGDESESLLDLEWANAVAPAATIVLVSAQDTETSAGPELAAVHVLDSNLATVMNLSYGLCEAGLGNTGNLFINSIWQQAAAQGITVTVSSGDNGSAGCDNPNTEYLAQYGLQVSGLASTPYNVAVGGTDFNDVGTQSNYFSSFNTPTTLQSATTYIPERTWNESCAALASASSLNVCPTLDLTNPAGSLSLWTGSGGPSSCSTSTVSGGVITCQSGTAKPSWQSGTGVPADGVRDIPDVSLYSAGNSDSRSFYVLCERDAVFPYASCSPGSGSYYFLAVGGTSVAAPSFAGIMALANQKAGTRLGNINPILYSLAAGSGASCASSAAPGSSCIFYDITTGNNSVPCKAGSPNCSATSGSGTGVLVTSSGAPAYMATTGYDLATGLGSVNATNLVNGISSKVGAFTPTTTALTLNGATSAVTANHGDAITVGVSVSPTSSAGSVSLLGASGGIDSQALASGAATWTSKLFPGGAYSVKAHYPGDGTHGASDSSGISVTINPEASKTFVNLVSFDALAGINFGATSVPYGSPYVLRIDVGDSASTLSSSQGINSKCSTNSASCPTGNIRFSINGAVTNSYNLNSQGYAEDQLVQYNVGTYSLSASYAGDSSYNASTGTASINITKAPTTLTALTESSYTYGSLAGMGARVTTTSSGVAPTGTISAVDNGASKSGGYISQGQNGTAASYASALGYINYPLTSIGTHTVSLQYSGDQNYSGSNSDATTLNVVQANPFTACQTSLIAATLTMPVTINCLVYASPYGVAPTGTTVITDNFSPLSAPVTYSNLDTTYQASSTVTFSQTGSHSIGATYSGDTNYKSSTSATTPNINVYDKIPLTVNGPYVALNPALVNFPTTITTYFYSPDYRLSFPTGTITFLEDGQPLNGVTTVSTSNQFFGTITYTPVSVGTHTITATYSGDSNYAAATTQPLSLQVMDKLQTQMSGTYSSAPVIGQQITLQTYVQNTSGGGPLMSGTVTFFDGGTQLSGSVNYSASNGLLLALLPYVFTTTGNHNITAQYSGDSHYAASTMSSLIVNVTGPFTVNIPSTSYQHSGGGTIQDSLFLANQTSSPLTVTMSCTSDSTAATCKTDQSSYNVQPFNPVQVAETFTFPGLTARNLPHRRPFSTMPFVFAGVIAGLAFTTRRRRVVALSLLALAMVLSFASCGGGGGNNGGGVGNPPPTPKTYHFTMTATSGSYTESHVITVTVTQ